MNHLITGDPIISPSIIEEYKSIYYPEDWKEAETHLFDMLNGCDCLYEMEYPIRLSDTSE